MSSRSRRMQELLDALDIGTAGGNVRWVSTDRQGTFLFTGPSGSVRLSGHDPNEPGRLGLGSIGAFAAVTTPLEITVLNERGQEVDSASMLVAGSVAMATTDETDLVLRERLPRLYERVLEQVHGEASRVTSSIIRDIIGGTTKPPGE